MEKKIMKFAAVSAILAYAAIQEAAAGISAASDSDRATLMWYESPAVKWTDALPVGNGQMGAMVFGGVESERLQFNEYTLWTGKPHSYARKGAAEALPEIRRLVAEGKKNESAKLADRAFLANPKLEAAYQPCGDLYVRLDGVGGSTGYRRELCLRTGVARSEFSANGVKSRFLSVPPASKIGAVSNALMAAAVASGTVAAESL